MCACRPMGSIAATISAVVLILAGTELSARASAEQEHVHIRFSAPKGCPDAPAFIRALRQRTTRFRQAASHEQVRSFVATITRADSFFSGRLETQAPGRETSERTVTGKTCDDVMSVLAFMTALAIDPSTSPQNPSAARPASPTRSSPLTTSPANPPDREMPGAAADAPASNQSASRTAPSTPPPAPRAAESPPFRPDGEPPIQTPSLVTTSAPAAASAGDPSPRWKWSAGADGQVSLGVSPTTGFGGLLFVEAAAPGTAVWGPALRAGVFLNQSLENLTSGAEAEFQWAAVLVEGCPMRLFFFNSGLALHACLASHLGALRARGRGLNRTQETTDLWADLGPVVRARVALSRRLFLEGQGMLVVPLRRLSYDVYFAGPAGAATTVHMVPRLGALLGIGVAYEFR